MSAPSGNPYSTLGVEPGASDAELRRAYRRLVQLHHPDHNAGSSESAQRFEEVQEAYARVREERSRAGTATAAAGGGRHDQDGTGGGRHDQDGTGGGRHGQDGTGGRNHSHVADGRGDDPIEDRLRAMEQELNQAREAREREVRQARAAREQAARAAREAAHAARATERNSRTRASDEELGIYETDDSFAKILSDVRADVTELFGRAISAAERAAEDAARRAADRRAGDGRS